MPYSQTDIDGLRAVIAKGVLRYRFEDGRETTYQSLSDMRSLLKEMEGDVAISSGARRRRGNSVAGF